MVVEGKLKAVGYYVHCNMDLAILDKQAAHNHIRLAAVGVVVGTGMENPLKVEHDKRVDVIAGRDLARNHRELHIRALRNSVVTDNKVQVLEAQELEKHFQCLFAVGKVDNRVQVPVP